jgi:hypothetical protein
MVLVFGTLKASLLPNGNVKTALFTDKGDEIRPLLAKNMDTAEQDFVRHYGMSPAEAAAFRVRIECDGSATVSAAL